MPKKSAAKQQAAQQQAAAQEPLEKDSPQQGAAEAPTEPTPAEPTSATPASAEAASGKAASPKAAAKHERKAKPARRSVKVDAVLSTDAAVEFAREAALTVARPDEVGDHAGFRMDTDRVGTHVFQANKPGYVGWQWAVTIARAPRSKTLTVCEVDLLPADGALLAPPWVPWEDRLQPGDVSRDDVLPYRAQDDRLDESFEDVGEDADSSLSDELGLGRPRVLSAQGRAQAARRWYASQQGPGRGRLPKATCSTCGFLVKMSGSMRTMFGVCANEWSPDDGRVVSLDHTCGAHSETDVPRRGSEWPVRPSRINDFVVETHVLPQ